MEHLDANTVAAFSARTLSAQERSLVFDHLADCDACRAWIAANAEINFPKRLSPVWAPIAAAAGIACAFFALWLILARSPREPLQAVNQAHSVQEHVPAPQAYTRAVRSTEVRKQVAATPRRRLPAAWEHIRLTPAHVSARPVDQVALRTNVGEKWIPAEEIWGSVVPQFGGDILKRRRSARTYETLFEPLQIRAQYIPVTQPASAISLWIRGPRNHEMSLGAADTSVRATVTSRTSYIGPQF
jgi:hypothetical protein